jgi:carbon storage regulator
MLILSRKSGESIVIDGRILVKIVRVEGDVVKVGIEASSDVPVHRQEVYEEIQRSNRQALTRQSVVLPKLTGKLGLKSPKLASVPGQPSAPVQPLAPTPGPANTTL